MSARPAASAGESRAGIERVTVAILTWNGRGHLAHCLPALAAQQSPGVPWEVLLLDNGSSDGTAAWVRREHPEVRLIESPVNLGFAAGVNRLVEAATGDAVALLNNDTRPDRVWLAALVAALAGAPPDVAAVSGLIVDWEGRRLDFAQGAMTFDGHAFQLGFRRPLAEVGIPAAGAELPFPCGGNVLVRRRSFRAAGGFDPDYFAYLEDVDLGWRLWSGGERVLFAPEARVRHRSAGTSELLGLYNRGFLFERNAYLTAYKNYEDGLFERLMPAVQLTLLSRVQALLAHHNPGGELLTVDPYAGHIADTARAKGDRHLDAPSPSPPSQGARDFVADPASRGARDFVADPQGAAAQGAAAQGARDFAGRPHPAPDPVTGDALLARLRRAGQSHGPREALRRVLLKTVDRLLGSRQTATASVHLTDPRTIAQLRALSYLLGHLDEAADKRRAVQARRRRPDREYFERFPLYVVPTYPGDEALFRSPGFRALLPADLPFYFRDLDQVMKVG